MQKTSDRRVSPEDARFLTQRLIDIKLLLERAQDELGGYVMIPMSDAGEGYESSLLARSVSALQRQIAVARNTAQDVAGEMNQRAMEAL